jgi:uncharacterized protein YdhG (YjbR/CyaY superfamily)
VFLAFLRISPASLSESLSGSPMSTTVVESLAEELKPYVAARGTLHFTPDNPIPAALVRKVVKARIEERRTGTSLRPQRLFFSHAERSFVRLLRSPGP